MQCFDGVQNLILKSCIFDRVQSFLQDIVAKLVVYQLLDDEVHSSFKVIFVSSQFGLNGKVILRKASLENLFNVSLLPDLETLIQAFFNNIAREFKLTESDEVFGYQREDAFVFGSIVQLDHILNQVVAVRVFDQSGHELDDVLSQVKFLLLSTLLKASLHHAAAMLVLANLKGVGHTSFENELGILGC